MTGTLRVSRALAGASILVLAIHGAASAQDEERPIEDLSDAIYVTATKSADPENVQDIPLAITAFGEPALDALNVRDLQDLSFSVPNVSLDDIGTNRGLANFSIRGLGVNSGIASLDPTVGVFVDGIYLGINAGVVFDTFDLEGVEILRGPQGVLFGRNTTGGAVLVNTTRPSDTFEAGLRYAVEAPAAEDRGGLNQYLMGRASGPIVPGVLNGKIAAYLNDDEGYFENRLDGSDIGANRTRIVRGALEWLAADDLTFLARAELFENDGDGPVSQNRGTFDRDSFGVSIDEVGFIDAQARSLSLRTDYDVGPGTLTNIFGYRDYQQDTLGDIDSLPAFLFHSPTQTEQDQVSNELRYAAELDRFDLRGGLFYFDQKIGVNEERFIPSAPIPEQVGGGIQDQTVYGVFGQLGFDLTEDLTLLSGLRFSYEEKDVSVVYVQPRETACDVLRGTCPTGDPLQSGFSDDDAWQNFSPKLALQWMPRPDLQLYSGWTRSFRSGGYNIRVTDVNAFIEQTSAQGEVAFDEERVDSFEVGTKFEAFEGRLQTNAAVFHTEVKDMQREVNISDPDAGVTQVVTNTADARITGAEIEVQAVLTDNLLIQANYGHIDARYDDVRFDISSDGLIDGVDEGLAIPRVPENTYGAALVHDMPLGRFGSLLSRVGFQHRDAFAYTDNNFGWINAADMLDFNLTWQTPADGVEISVYGKNMLDEVIAGGDTQLPFGGFEPATAEDGGTGLAGPNSDLSNDRFGERPRFGTLSPLKKGRRIGLELDIRF